MDDFSSKNRSRNTFLSEFQHDEEEEEEACVWRRDPELSFSDWTIKVVQSSDSDSDNCSSSSSSETSSDSNSDSNNNETTTMTITTDTNANANSNSNPNTSWYYVHRVYMASGPRKSEYFQTLFSLATSTQESLSDTTTLVLPESACRAFPRLLDFIYDTRITIIGGYGENNTNNYRPTCSLEEEEEEEDVYSSLMASGSGDGSDDGSDDGDAPAFREEQDDDNDDDTAIKEAVALAFLADYLRVPKLVPLAYHAIQSLMNQSNVHLFCKEALAYTIDWLVEDCIHLAAKSPKDLLLASDPQAGRLRYNAHHSPSSLFCDDDDDDDDGDCDGKERNKRVLSKLLVPPALQTMRLLRPHQQVELLRLSLSKSLRDVGRFRKVRFEMEEEDYNYKFKT